MIELIFGLGIVAFLFFYLSFALDKSHFIFKLLLLVFGIIVLVLVPKASLDDTCTPVLNHTLINNSVVNMTTTQYFYSDHCTQTTTNNTSNIFYKLNIGFFVIFWIYVFGYIAYAILKYFGYIVGGGKK